MGIEASYNFRRINDTLTTSGVVADMAGLGDEGYQLVINLLPDDNEWAVEGEATIVQDQGVGYVSIPVDFEAPTSEQLQEFTAVMDAHPGESIHVHCAANYRVSAFYGLYAVSRGTWTTEEADEHVHSLWTPDEVWQAFIDSERARITE